MLRGNFAPEQELMRLYEQPVMANISYCKITKDPFPTPQEAQVWFKIGQEEQTAFVPLRIVNEQNRTVTAALIGEVQGRIVVSFPPTNFGTTKFHASAEELEKIATRADGTGG